MKDKLRHVAIILDGNGRWAKERNKIRSYGHKVGFNNIKRIAFYANDLGIEYMTVYCFSTENWNRPQKEVDFLMSLPRIFEVDIPKYTKKNIKINILGRKDRIPSETLKALNHVSEATKDCTGMVLNICFDYGAINDLTNGINELLKSGKTEIKEEEIYDLLATRNMPRVDLLIRCGGEQRLSNYLLLECAYAEFEFIKTYWPDFTKETLDECIEEFNNRHRRFGGIKE